MATTWSTHFSRTALSVIGLALVASFAGCSSKKKKDAPAQVPMDKHQSSNSASPEVAQADAHSKSQKPHWTYDGIFGPDLWGSLDTAFETCKTGKNQSPIDLLWKRPEKGGSLDFDYRASTVSIVDNGHTIQVNVPPGNRANFRGEDYELIQIHFHSQSEHAVGGKQFPIEIHFVHKDSAGRLAVIGVMVKEGVAHPGVAQLWNHIPKQKNLEQPVGESPINPHDLLPSRRTYYHYSGSLTTPPCTEGVNWNVFNTPIEMSADQIAAFRMLYAKNNRPLQPLNERPVVNY